MSDVDDELLALAGGNYSSDEEDQQEKRHAGVDDDDDDENDAPMNISRSGSESREASPAKRKSDASASRSTAAKKTSAKKSKRRANFDDDSEEEGEASSMPSSPASLQSAPMEESDSDSDADVVPRKGRGAGAGSKDDDEDENRYPVDGLFISLEEKEEIMNMREVEREQILAERAQEKDRIHQNKLLRQLVSNDEQRKKRSATAADLDEGQRKTSRVRTKLGGTKVGETNSAMDTLKSRRAEKHERTRRREEDRERRKDRSSPIGRDRDDEDDEDESDVEWAKATGKSRSPETKVSQTVELRDIERIRLSRTRFGQVCFYPGFDNAISGTFVRISIGPEPGTHEPVYRMAMVKGFTKGKAYAITGPQGQHIVTDQYVLAAHGKAQREWPFLACSDSPFTEAEWSRYQKVCGVDGVSIPKKGILLNKADDINKLINRSWTEDELTQKVQRQQALKNRFNGVEKMRIEYGIKEAKALGNYDRAEQLQEELQRLETPRLAFKTSLTQVGQNGGSGGGDQGNGGLSQQERLARLNAENRRHNAEAVRRAQLKERARVREIERKIERGENVEEDHSRRLRTRAKFVHDIHDAGPEKKPASQAGSGTTTPANGTPQLGAQKTLPHMVKLQQQQREAAKNGLPMIHRPIGDDDIIASLDLDIDENIFDD